MVEVTDSDKTLAHYGTELMVVVKSFIVHALEANSNGLAY
jgi:hypothetical protein